MICVVVTVYFHGKMHLLICPEKDFLKHEGNGRSMDAQSTNFMNTLVKSPLDQEFDDRTTENYLRKVQ
ncbi:hypothetical protein GCM10028868_08340 [Virgibacillus kimchii]